MNRGLIFSFFLLLNIAVKIINIIYYLILPINIYIMEKEVVLTFCIDIFFKYLVLQTYVVMTFLVVSRIF